MGEVYLAEDTKLDRKVALKFLPPEFVENRDRMSRFVREAKSASALNHPNIITIYEINEFEGTHFIATEYIDGKTLKKYTESNSSSIDSVLEIAVQIAGALQEAHSVGIIHRDIKPENIMIRPNGLVKLLDFGIAKLSGPSESADESNSIISDNKIKSSVLTDGSVVETNPGLIIGTPNYMSPEQAEGNAIDTRTDIYSFGVVLYEMFTGRFLSDSTTALKTIVAFEHKERKPLDEFEIPVEVKSIIDKCLRKNKNERYQTINEVLIDLQDLEKERALRNEPQRTLYSAESTGSNTQKSRVITANDIHRTTNELAKRTPVINRLFVIGLLFLLALAAGFAGYRYLLPENQIESIAVIPFINESENADLEYLSEGMTETLIKSLSKIPNLSVKARSAVFYYKGKKTSPKIIGEELDVRAVLLGRISRQDDDLQLSLELVDTETQNVLWTHQYRRGQNDLLTLQNEIALDVSSVLRNRLSTENEKQLTKNSTQDNEAYKLYLQGRYMWNKRTKDGYRQAMDFFQQAIDKDPKFALAYVGLADSTAFLYAPDPSRYVKAKAIVQKAIEIDNSLGEAHTTLGLIFQNSDQNWSEAEREYKRAIELEPNYATTHQWYGELLIQLGRVDEALVHFQKAAEIDPFSLPINADLGIAYYFARQTDRAIEQLDKMIKKEPNFYRSYFYLARIYESLGQYENAIAARQKGFLLTIENAGLVQKFIAELTDALKVSGERGYWQKRLEMKKNYPNLRGVWDCDIIGIYIRLGDKDKAFAEMEKQYQDNVFDLLFLKVSPEFDEIRSDARFQDLVRRLRLS